jgi:hypothetical protein
VLAAAAAEVPAGSAESPVTARCEAISGRAAPAPVAHAMIPEAIDDAGPRIVPPTAAGSLSAVQFALSAALA